MLIKECLLGMIPFLILVALNVFMFSLMNFTVQTGPFSTKFFPKIIGENYRTIFGENVEGEYDKESIPTWAIYWMFTIQINTVMMNLLIAIIGDHFDKVQASQLSTHSKEMCQLLKEFGETFFDPFKIKSCMMQSVGQQKKDQLYYIHKFTQVGKDDDETGEEEPWMGRLKEITSR